MRYRIIYSELFDQTYTDAKTHAFSVGGRMMLGIYDGRLVEIVEVIRHSPFINPVSHLADSSIRKVRFYGPYMLYYKIDEEKLAITLLTLWDGRREGSPRL